MRLNARHAAILTWLLAESRRREASPPTPPATVPDEATVSGLRLLGLSPEAIAAWFRAAAERREAEARRLGLAAVGVPWSPPGAPPQSPNERAARSRALRQLEREGFVQRRDSEGGRVGLGGRTTYVRLTTAGRREAEMRDRT
jgi:hypothetical protein